MTTTNKLFIYKYKPVMFSDYQVNRATIEIIETFLKMEALNLILYGETASGKTTLLNTIIHEYYRGHTEQEREDNILYINNLREQGIHFYRNDVKIFCQTCSNIHGKKKMVVIDDIDLISEQSQQVFRNCIDKYGKNVFFVITCTVIQKVIDNLQSRLQIIKMQRFDPCELRGFIDYIQAAEGIQIDADAKEFVLKLSDYSIQLLVHYMEKFYILNERITLAKAHDLCSNISFYVLDEYIGLIRQGDRRGAISYIYTLYDRGYSVIDILDTFFVYVKTTDKLDEQEKYQTIELLCKYITVFYNIHEDEIELAFFTNNMISHLCHV